MSLLRTVVMPALPMRAATTLRWLDAKGPSDDLDYTFDIRAWLGADTVASVVAAVSPAGSGDIVIQSQSFTAAGLITVWLTGGNVGTDYAVTITVTTTAGRVLERQLWLACQHMSPAGAVGALVAGAAVPVTRFPIVLANGAVTLSPPAAPAAGLPYVLQFVDGAFSWAVLSGASTATTYWTDSAGNRLTFADGSYLVRG